jgi:hypothetical protein
MTESGALQHLQQTTADACPTWCASQHGVQEGEEDWVHVGAPLDLGNGVRARLCMSRDPHTGSQDGPVVLIGDHEYTLTEAAALGVSLAALALGVEAF